MTLALNLRFDLRRLSDAELAHRLDKALSEAEEGKYALAPSKLRSSYRGLIRHRMAYPITSVLEYSGRFFWDFGWSLWPWLQAFLLEDQECRALMRMHLAACEAKDIMDEAERRLKRSGRR